MVRIVVVSRDEKFIAKTKAELEPAHKIVPASPDGFRMPDGETQVIIDLLCLEEAEHLAIRAQSGSEHRVAIGTRGPYDNLLAKRHRPESSYLGDLYD